MLYSSMTVNDAPSSIVAHIVGMTFLLFVAVPYLTISFLNPAKSKTNQCIRTSALITCSVLFVCFGASASYTSGDHRSVHAIFGLIIISLLIPIWTISQIEIPFLKMDQFPLMMTIRKGIIIAMMVLILPTQWMLGLHFICKFSLRLLKLQHQWGFFMGHYLISYCMMSGGVAIIWYCTEMEMIMMGEISVMASGATLSMIGLLSRDFNEEKPHPHFWHHIMMEGTAFVFAALCWLVHKLKVPRRNLFHGLCWTLFWVGVGRMMLMHQTGGDLRETMHEIFAILCFGTAIARMGCIFWDKLAIIYGSLMFWLGIFLNFASLQYTRYWQVSQGYPPNSYVMIVIMLCFYFLSIVLTAKQTVQQTEIKKIDTIDEDRDGIDEKVLLMDDDIDAMCTEMV